MLDDQRLLCPKSTDVNVLHVPILHDFRNCKGKEISIYY